MAKPPELFMRVQADPEKIEALESSVQLFRHHANEVEKAFEQVQRAINGLEFTAIVERKESP